MRNRIPSLQSLLILDAAVKHGSFSRAADALSLTHSAVSQQVRTLQERLGMRLFVREGQGMRATPACLALVAQVRHAVSLLDRTFEAAPRRASIGHLTVSVLPHFATGWLIARLPDFATLDERITVDLVGSHVIDDLAGSGIDAAIRFGPGDWPGLVTERLGGETAFPVCAPSFLHNVRSGIAMVHARAFLRSPFPPWEPWLQKTGTRLQAEPSGSQFGDPSLLLRAVMLGQGIGLARHLIVADDLREGRLVRLTESSVEEPYAYFLVWRPHNPRRTLIKEFCEWLKFEIDKTHVLRV